MDNPKKSAPTLLEQVRNLPNSIKNMVTVLTAAWTFTLTSCKMGSPEDGKYTLVFKTEENEFIEIKIGQHTGPRYKKLLEENGNTRCKVVKVVRDGKIVQYRLPSQSEKYAWSALPTKKRYNWCWASWSDQTKIRSSK